MRNDRPEFIKIICLRICVLEKIFTPLFYVSVLFLGSEFKTDSNGRAYTKVITNFAN